MHSVLPAAASSSGPGVGAVLADLVCEGQRHADRRFFD
jgi:glycine/D-amino acid oxidase-like deaminating enzyme